MKTVAIIGGGASGHMAAITLARRLELHKQKANILLFEKLDRVGKKLLATGNGCCNITNLSFAREKYHGDTAQGLKILSRISPENTIEFFKSIGVICKAKPDGRVYPYSMQASAVLECLRAESKRLGITECCSEEIEEIRKERNGEFWLKSNKRTLNADIVIVTAGGRSEPSLGGSLSGYELLRQLGHTSTDTYPALVQIKTSTEPIKGLKGVKVDANISLVQNMITVKQEKGELLFTEYGVSGPPIFQLSRIVSTAQKGAKLKLWLDIMPEYTPNELYSMLKTRRESLGDVPLEQFMSGMINKRLGMALMKYIGAVPLTRMASTLSLDELKLLAANLKRWELHVTGTLSWGNAQVTAGGVPVSEFNDFTLESIKCDGLFAAGEVLNIDGDCGGFNLQWAWSSGCAAGLGAAAAIIGDRNA